MWIRLTPVVLLVTSMGCAAGQPTPPAATTSQPQGHRHERDRKLIADAGKYHALLTAHLSAQGHELDIFFESPESDEPVALPLDGFTAQATSGDGAPQELHFEPASATERPKDEKPGTCSHFVARSPWLQPDDTLLVVARLYLDGREVKARWKNFMPRKHAHPVE